jgi:RimJ/RimL family protein N-acetyltransferase
MSSTFNPVPVTLEGQAVRLEPLDPRHAEDLFAAGQDKEIWRYLARPPFEEVSDAESWIVEALRSAINGSQIPFAIVDRASGKAIGSTRYLEIEREHSSLEIGWTWIAKPFQRTRVNTECKYLLLRHAFENLHAIRVQLKTDARNLQSQRAIQRLGAMREGTLRKHRRLWDGYVRDSVYFSILDGEWLGIKQRLEAGLVR